MKNSIWQRSFIAFINGVVILLPIIVTVIIIRFMVIKVNDIVLNPLMQLFMIKSESQGQVYIVKIFIFAAVICAIMLIGWGARILVITRIFSWGENMFVKIPILGRIYNAIKQISSAFIGRGRTIFRKVVLVEYPRKEVFSIGFTTGSVKGEIKTLFIEETVNVFIPTTPNPTSGIFIMVSKKDVKFLDMSVEDGMKLVISGGSVIPDIKSYNEK